MAPLMWCIATVVFMMALGATLYVTQQTSRLILILPALMFGVGAVICAVATSVLLTH